MPKVVLQDMKGSLVLAWQRLQALNPTGSGMPLELGSGKMLSNRAYSVMFKRLNDCCQSCMNSMVCLLMNIEASRLVMFLSEPPSYMPEKSSAIQ